MKKIIGGIIILFIIIVVAGNANKKDTNSDTKSSTTATETKETKTQTSETKTQQDNHLPDFSKLTPTCFTPYPKKPILKNDSLFSGSHWNDSHVLKIGSQYVMYASSDNGFNKNVKIYHLVSDDGIQWSLSPTNAVFEHSSDKSAWDSASTETPAVVYFKGMYYLFYTGYTELSDAFSYKIGYATSPDGINWTRKQNNPLLEPNDPKGKPNFTFNQYIVGEPAPVVVGDKLYLYFTTMGVDNVETMATLETIGLITTSDGDTWTKPVRALVPDQKLYPRKDGWIGYSTPHAQVLGGKVHLFFDIVNEKPKWHQEKIQHAISSDGITNWVQDSKPIFSREDFDWTKDELLSPSVYLDGNTLMLWFSGNKGYELGIGFATCKL